MINVSVSGHFTNCSFDRIFKWTSVLIYDWTRFDAEGRSTSSTRTIEYSNLYFQISALLFFKVIVRGSEACQ